MNIQHKFNGGTLQINLIGELDESHAEFVRDNLDEIFRKRAIDEVIIDLSRLSFMDSTGIGVPIGRYKILNNRGIGLKIASPSRPVDKVLSLTGIYKIMPKIIQ